MDELQGPMTKAEVAEFLGISIQDILKWTQPFAFASWLDVCPTEGDRQHDEDDILMLALINKLSSCIEADIPFDQRVRFIEQALWSVPEAVSIRKRREAEKERPEIMRWEVVNSTTGACLRYEYEWLRSLHSAIDSIADFGCWATEVSTCSEPYALLWTLEATRVVVIDKNPEYIQNAQNWLGAFCERHPHFQDYNLEFIVGDMTVKIDGLDADTFDLAYCKNVLYNMYTDSKKLQASIKEMARIVKTDGWIIAIEPKMGVEYREVPLAIFNGGMSLPCPTSEPIDIGHLFEAVGLVRVNMDDAPAWSYLYKRPHD